MLAYQSTRLEKEARRGDSDPEGWNRSPSQRSILISEFVFDPSESEVDQLKDSRILSRRGTTLDSGIEDESASRANSLVITGPE